MKFKCTHTQNTAQRRAVENEDMRCSCLDILFRPQQVQPPSPLPIASWSKLQKSISNSENRPSSVLKEADEDAERRLSMDFQNGGYLPPNRQC